MTEQKKGKKSWKPSALLHTKKMPGHQSRWVNALDPANYQRRMADGWVPDSKINGGGNLHERPGHIEDGSNLTSVTEYRGMVLCHIPDEEYQEHRDYYNEQTRRQTAGLWDKAEAENRAKARGGMAAKLYGKTHIE